jgi:HlyD family secretion protein
MFKNKRKIIISIVSVLILLLISIISVSCMGMGSFSGTADDSANQEIEIFKVKKGSIYQLISTTGSVDSDSLNTYTLQGTGEIISALEKGDSFKKGDVLAEVDNSEGLLQLEKIENNLKLSEISYKEAKLNYQKSMDTYHITLQLLDLNTQKAEESTESALDSLEDAKEKGESSSISQAESSYKQALLSQSTTYWNNLSSLQSAEAQMESAKDNLNQAGIQLELARMDVESANEDLSDYILNAPYDGIVISSDFETGNQNGGNSISIISDNFLIDATIGETDISKISENDEAYITLDAYPDIQILGEVEKIIPVTIEDGNITSFEIIVKFNDTEDANIYYGLSASVDIVIEKAEDILYVPIQAVYTENGKNYVDLLVTGQVDSENMEQAVNKVEVTTGINDYSYIEITSGLNEGDIIVTSRL